MSDQHNVWVESLWSTHKESLSIRIENDIVTREISIGMSVRAEKGTSSSVLHEKLNQALTKLVEDEKDAWLTAELIKREREHVKESVAGMDSLVSGKYQVVEPAKPVSNAKPQISLML